MTKENKKELKRRNKKDYEFVKNFMIEAFGIELLSSVSKKTVEQIFQITHAFFLRPFRNLDLYDLKFDDSWPKGIPIIFDRK